MSRLIKVLTAAFAIFTIIVHGSDQIPAPAQPHPILITDVTLHPVSSEVIKNGQILFEYGIIITLGKDVGLLPDNTETISLPGKHVYPGFVAANTTMGLVEIQAIRATLDVNETGDFNPNIRAEVSYNPDSELIPVARSNGITVAHTIPKGGLISGSSAAMLMDGWTTEDVTLKAPVGMHLNWPAMDVGTGEKRKEREKKRDKKLEEIELFFREARAYLRAKEAAETANRPMDIDLRWEAMIPVLKGELPMIIHANRVRQIETAVHWTRQQNIRMILADGRDSWRVTDLLKKYEIPVILASVHSLPARRWEDYDTPYTTPLKLHQASVQYCIAMSRGFFVAAHIRNLPYHAATAAAYGLPKEEALKSITLYPAEILGIADRVGSLEPGKDATLIITNGDPLEITTQVEIEFIQGRKIDLSDRQKMLYAKYQEKYRQLRLIK